MRYARLPLALAAMLTLGAAPPQPSRLSQAAECGLSHAAAATAIGRLPALNRNVEESEHATRIFLSLDPAGLTVLGFPAQAFDVTETNAIPGDQLTLTTRLDAPWAAVRAAALRRRGKAACAEREGPPDYCEVGTHQSGGWSISFIVQMFDGHPIVVCDYWKLRR